MGKWLRAEVHTRLITYLRAWTFQPQNLRQIITMRVRERVLEHFHFLHQRQMLVIRRHT